MAVTPKDDTKRKRLPSQERRAEFIEKAIAFFAEEGFESSTRELAKRLGVTQPLLYRYFPSKDDLISEVYQTVYIRRWQPEWEALISDRSRPLEERLRDFYTAYINAISKPDWVRIFLFAGLKGIDINARYLDVVREKILDPIVVEARAEDGLETAAPSDAERSFAWLIHGGLFYSIVREVVYADAPTLDRSQNIAAAVDAMLLGLKRVRRDA